MNENEKMLQAIRNLDDGTGIEVTIGDSENGVDFYYTNNLKNDGLPQGMEVEMISTESPDKELLHKLLQETKKPL